MIRKLKQLYRTWHLLDSLTYPARLPYAWDLDKYLAPYGPSSRNLPESSSLDIGCGSKPWNPFRAKHLSGVDIRANEEGNVRYADLTTEPIPFPDGQFDYVTARDFLEHIPRIIYAPARRLPFIELMNEVWRVLKPRAVFLSRTPFYPFSQAFRDPTHVNIISVETFPLYFDHKNRWAAMYGFTGAFRVIEQAVEPPHLLSLLERCES